MSISSALSNALSGLTAASRAAEIVSSNLANVMTEGYGRRDIALSSRAGGGSGGVTIDGIIRHSDRALVANRRAAQSGLANAETTLSFLSRLESMVGTPDMPTSLSAQYATFESDLLSATSRPDSNVRLQKTVQSAQTIVSSFNRLSDGIQAMRSEADNSIKLQVNTLNTSLSQISDLNKQITKAIGLGLDTSSLVDQRQILVDKIGEIVPIKEVARERGTIALFTPGGAILLDGKAAQVDFSGTNLIAPHMTQQSGDLSGLAVNGVAISTDQDRGPLSGGTLGALFEIRDDFAVMAQAQLDGVARDIVERFQDSGLDSTLAPGAAGLFTDEGIAFSTANEVGLSGRLELNASVDPAQGGEAWRLRDGLGAFVSGDVGNGDLLNAMIARLGLVQPAAAPSLGGVARTASGMVSSFLENTALSKTTAEQAAVFANVQTSEFKAAELQQGVDSDQEMQKLMLIEQAYAANARMIQMVDEMMQTLLRI